MITTSFADISIVSELAIHDRMEQKNKKDFVPLCFLFHLVTNYSASECTLFYKSLVH